MKIGVIGFGSIGKRHCENLKLLGYNNVTLLRTKNKGNQLGLEEEYDEEKFIKTPYDFIILSNPSSLHTKYLEKLIISQHNLLVEKPIGASEEDLIKLGAMIRDYKGKGMIAYNLRFHPCVKKVKAMLKKNALGKIYYAYFYVGQYLPDWRSDIDYRESYSAKKELGGGVILDLIHEIDLSEYFFGKIGNNFHAIVDKVSKFEINCEDIANIHYKSELGIVISIHLDYLRRGYARYFEIVCERATVHCDLYKAKITITGNENIILNSFDFNNFNRNQMYLSMLQYYIECIKKNKKPFPSIENGLSSLNTALIAKSFWRKNENRNL